MDLLSDAASKMRMHVTETAANQRADIAVCFLQKRPLSGAHSQHPPQCGTRRTRIPDDCSSLCLWAGTHSLRTAASLSSKHGRSCKSREYADTCKRRAPTGPACTNSSHTSSSVICTARIISRLSLASIQTDASRDQGHLLYTGPWARVQALPADPSCRHRLSPPDCGPVHAVQ